MRAISNVRAGRIRPADHRFSALGLHPLCAILSVVCPTVAGRSITRAACCGSTAPHCHRVSSRTDAATSTWKVSRTTRKDSCICTRIARRWTRSVLFLLRHEYFLRLCPAFGKTVSSSGFTQQEGIPPVSEKIMRNLFL